MTLDLSTLQERYPHGSEWRWRIDSGGPLRTVVGWETGPVGAVIWKVNGTPQIVRCSPSVVDESFDRVVPPPPCPITEPTTIWPADPGRRGRIEWHSNGAYETGGDTAPITLYPPGAAIDGKRYRVHEVERDDVYRFTDRVFILGTWGGAA